MRLIASPCVLSAALLMGSIAEPQNAPRFPTAQYPMGGLPYGLVLGDLNEDGALDAVTAERLRPGSITVALGDGSGRFGPPTTHPVGDNPEVIRIGHFDLDAHLDVIAATEDSGHLTLLHGDGAGGFSLVEHIAVGQGPTSVDAGDLNGDGHTDLVTVVEIDGDSGYSVLLADGQGGFEAPVFEELPGSGHDRVRLAHLDGDGNLDLVHVFHHSVAVARGNGAGGFSPAASHPTGSSGSSGSVLIDVADFDQDGNNDLVTAVGPTSVPPSDNLYLNVKFGDGMGGFSPAVSFPSAPDPVDGRAVDLNGDLAMDVVVVHGGPTNALSWPGAATLSVFLGDGAGGFAPREEIPAAYGQGYVAIADLDSNGALDLVVSCPGPNTIGVFLAETPGNFILPRVSSVSGQTFALGDLDGSGTVDAVTMGSAGVEVFLGDGLGSFTSGGPALSPGSASESAALGDMNMDGHADLVALLSSGPVGVWTGDGAGGLTESDQEPGVAGPRDIALGDFDNDGLLDAATASSLGLFPFSYTSSVSAFLGDGAGGLAPPVTTPVTGLGRAVSLAVADFDGNGLDDAAVGVSSGGVVLFGDGLGGFLASPLELPLDGLGVDVAIGDVDRDGELDLLYADAGVPEGVYFNGHLTVFLGDGLGGFAQHSTATLGDAVTDLALGDVDGDGLVDVTMTGLSHLSAVLVGDGQGNFDLAERYVSGASTRVADVNGDGRADWISRRSGLSVHLNQEVAPSGSTPIGTGTPGCNGTMGLLGSSAPSVGASSFGLIGTNAPKDTPGFLFLTLGSSPGGLLVNDVLFHLDLIGSPFLILLDMKSDAGGTAFAPLPIPDDAVLADVTITAQVVWGWSPQDLCSPSFFDLSSSVGLELTIAP